VSPLSIRRYRAERLLRSHFERLRGAVITMADRRLRARGICVDRSDLEVAYSQAWHGLYAAVLEGQEIGNPGGWLALVTYRRAVDEDRARKRDAGLARRGADTGARAAIEPDLARALDDRIRLRQLMEALRARLSARELQAASLCYLQGLPRAQAAAQMGVSEAAMRRLMDGRGGRSGVARKFGSLVGTIDSGEWCAEQGSLMRGLAFGILDPRGERYRLALSHQRECPACRSYVRSLRGLAAALPPVPMLMRWTLVAKSGAAAGAGAGGVGAAATGAGAGSSSAGAVGAASTTGAAGGGWLIASGGPAATKLAIGCLLALGVGAGCVKLSQEGARAPHATRARSHSAHASVRAHTAVVAAPRPSSERHAAAPIPPGARPQHLDASARAPREFGPEIGGVQSSAGRSPAQAKPRASAAAAFGPSSGATTALPTAKPARSEPAETSAGAAAAREFAPG